MIINNPQGFQCNFVNILVTLGGDYWWWKQNMLDITQEKKIAVNLGDTICLVKNALDFSF
jgi:hypothetical protein